MCTAITYHTKDHYFGRNLDLEYSYHETVTVTPRKYPFSFRTVAEMKEHYAMIGMAYVVDDYPLYYDATNEMGLSMAGLNFPGNAQYKPFTVGKENIAPFEFIPWILGQCVSITEARALLEQMNLVNIHFSNELPLSPLHWIIADKEGAITVEAMCDGIRIHENMPGVLTNNPPFEIQLFHLNDYMGLSTKPLQNHFAKELRLENYSRGMGALGLPGDLSSASRFVKAAFTKLNSVSGDSEVESVSQFFHILGSVEQQRGCVHMGEGKYEITIYSSCCNADRGIYYYTTYENRQITGVDMHREDLDSSGLICYSLVMEQQILMQNQHEICYNVRETMGNLE